MLLNKQGQDKEQGQALVEFALTLPILLMLTLGIIDLARLLFAYTHAVDAARQGVRYGIVTGLDPSVRQFFDCDGIRDAVRDLPGLTDPNSMTVNVSYEEADTKTKITDCVPGLNSRDVWNGDVLVVGVEGEITPVTPVLLMFTDRLPYSYTARRTIVAQGSAYTEEWPEPPPEALNFAASVDCSLAGNNVTFNWSPMSPIPDRAEIRNSVTGDVVVELNDTAPGLISNAFCNNCATIATTGGWGIFYLVAFSGQNPSEMAGPPSQDSMVVCDGSGGGGGPDDGTGSISGIVFNDKDGDGARKNVSEKGIESVLMLLWSAGPDGTFSTYDDPAIPYAQTNTMADGSFTFTGLGADDGGVGQNYRVEVVRTSPALGSMNPTTSVTRSVYLGAGQSYPGLLFGFN